MLDAFHRPVQPVRRITETVSVQDARLNRAVTLNLRLHEEQVQDDNPALVILFRGRRGQLLDNLTVTDGSGASLPVLSRAENKAIAQLLLDFELIRALGETAALPAPSPRQWLDLREIPTLTVEAAQARWKAMFESDPSDPFLDGLREHHRLRRITEFFVSNYLVMAELPNTDSRCLIVKFSYDTRYESDNSRRSWRWLVRGVSLIRPRSFEFEIPLAAATSSYHFRMFAPERHYCYDQYVADIAEPAPDSRPPLRRWDSTAWASSAVGLPYAHLYIHNLVTGATDSSAVERRGQGLQAVVLFQERPPGATGLSFVVACFVTLLLFFLHRLSEATPQSSLSHVPALVLALSGASTSWLPFMVSRSDLVTAPLTAKLTLLGSSLLSVLGSMTWLIDSGTIRIWRRFPVDVPRAETLRWLLLVAAGQAVFLAIMLVYRGAQFRRWKPWWWHSRHGASKTSTGVAPAADDGVA